MEKMSISERAAYNIQTREEFEILKSELESLVEIQFKEGGEICSFDKYNGFMKSAELRIKFLKLLLRGDVLEGLFRSMKVMGLDIIFWRINWNTQTIDIRFKWR